jgi:WD40 repeat protein
MCDGTVRLWDAATAKLIRTGINGVLGAAFIPAAPVLAVTDAYKAVRLWDTAAGTPLRT